MTVATLQPCITVEENARIAPHGGQIFLFVISELQKEFFKSLIKKKKKKIMLRKRHHKQKNYQVASLTPSQPFTGPFMWEDIEACPLEYLEDLLCLVAEAYPSHRMDLDG